MGIDVVITDTGGFVDPKTDEGKKPASQSPILIPGLPPYYPPGPSSGSTAPDPRKVFKTTPGAKPQVGATPAGTARPVIEQTSKPLSEQQLTVLAPGAYLPIAYGKVRIGAKIGWPFVTSANSGFLYFPAYWCQGEVESIAIYANDELLGWPVGTITLGGATAFEHYYGTAGQSLSAWLSSRIGYTDTHPNVAYSVIRINTNYAPNNIVAEIEGKKIYDPRKDSTNGGSGAHRVNDKTTWEYSTNPVLALADFHQSHRGHLETINWASVATCADNVDSIIGGVERAKIGLLIDRPARFEIWFATLLEYAMCFYYYVGNELYLRPDASVGGVWDGALTESSIVKGSLDLEFDSDIPDQVVVQYTDTQTTPWTEKPAKTPDPPGGAKVVQVLQMPGWQSYQQAYRYAITRLNKYTLMNLRGSVKLQDYGLKFTRGDVITVTNSRGLTAKPFRVFDTEAYDRGRYELQLVEYQPNVWSDVVESEPVYPDVDLPSPTDIPAVGALTAVERLWVDASGKYHTVFDLSFTGIEWPHLGGYRVKVYDVTDTLLAEQSINNQGGGVNHKWTTPPSAQDVTWTIRVWVVNQYMNIDPDVYSEITVTGNGKTIPPLDVPVATLTGFEFGQFVQLNWGASGDTDLAGYQIRRIPEANFTGGASDWTHVNSVVVMARTDSETALIAAQPVGEWRYGVKAIDRQGNFSTNARWTYVEVTADQAGSISVTTLNADPASLSNMSIYELYGEGQCVFTDDGGNWESRFGISTTPWQENSNLAYPWPWDMNVSCSFESLIWDTAVDRAGSWAWQPKNHYGLNDIDPTLETKTALESAFPTFTTSAGSAVAKDARYMRSRLSLGAGLNNGFIAICPVDASYQGAIKEAVQALSVPESPQPHAFVWDVAFIEKPEYSFVIESSQPVVAAFDSVTATGGNVRVWAATGHSTIAAGDPAPATVRVTARGP